MIKVMEDIIYDDDFEYAIRDGIIIDTSGFFDWLRSQTRTQYYEEGHDRLCGTREVSIDIGELSKYEIREWFREYVDTL